MILRRALPSALLCASLLPGVIAASPLDLTTLGAGSAAPRGPAGRSAPALPDRPYDALHYDLDITLHPETDTVDGILTLTLTPDEALERVELDFEDLAVRVAQVEGAEADFTHTGGILSVAGPFEAGVPATIAITYGGAPRLSAEGLGLWIRPPSQGSSGADDLAFTISEPDGARQIFPCNDTPADKATFTMRATVPEGWIVSSNGQLTEERLDDAGAHFVWEEADPIATYLVTLNAGPYERWEEVAGEVPIEYYARAPYVGTADLQWGRTPEQLDLFVERFGPYPFVKYGTVEAPMPFAAMEHQTLTLWRTSLFTTLAGDLDAAWSVTAHEATHHWFGDLVTPTRWEDIWLNEGFATYGEALWAEAEGGPQGLADFMKRTQDVYTLYKGYESASSLYDPDELFGVTSYQKGGAVVHMLRRTLGDDAFFAGLRIYLDDHAYGNATTEDLRSALEEASGLNLEPFFEDWVYRKGAPMPKLRVGWEGTREGVTLGIAQEGPAFTFPLPVRVTTREGAVQDVDLWLTGDAPAERFALTSGSNVKSVEIDPDHWILASIDEVSGLPGETCAAPEPCALGEPCAARVSGATCASGEGGGCGGGCGGEGGGSASGAFLGLLGLGLVGWRRRR